MPPEFDDQLKQRLIAFQTHHGLTNDGIVGADTWTRLIEGPQGGTETGDETCGCAPTEEMIADGSHLEHGEPDDLDGVLEEGEGDETGLQTSQRRPSGGSSSVPSQCRTTAKACFSVSQRTAWLLRPGRVLIVAVPALGGRPGHPTPTGQFSVHFKDEHHVSSIYHAPMPFYVNFAPAVGFHTGSLSVRSHGCVHLSNDNARRFFHHLREGDHVDVID